MAELLVEDFLKAVEALEKETAENQKLVEHVRFF